MAGHSKWANIKRKKEVKDAKKAKLFGKVTREIFVAIQQGDPNPETNARLRLAIQNAKAVSLPKDNIVRIIKKATSKETNEYIKASYEGYGPYGVGFLVEAMTDNANRTVAQLRSTFGKNGGNLDKKGSISHLFEHRGLFIIANNNLLQQEETTLELIEAGMEDMIQHNGELYITCLPAEFHNLQQALEAKNISLQQAGLKYLPITTTKLPPAQKAKVQKLIDALDDLDDVHYVYHNLA